MDKSRANLFVAETYDSLINRLDIERLRAEGTAFNIASNLDHIEKNIAQRDQYLRRVDALTDDVLGCLNEQNLLQYVYNTHHNVAYVTFNAPKTIVRAKLNVRTEVEEVEQIETEDVVCVLRQLRSGDIFFIDSKNRYATINRVATFPGVPRQIGAEVDTAVILKRTNKIVVYRKNHRHYFIIDSNTVKEVNTGFRQVTNLISLAFPQIFWSSAVGRTFVTNIETQELLNDVGLDSVKMLLLSDDYAMRITHPTDGKFEIYYYTRGRPRKFTISIFQTDEILWLFETAPKVVAIGFPTIIYFVDLVRERRLEFTRSLTLKRIEKYFDGAIALTGNNELVAYALPDLQRKSLLATNVKHFSCAPMML